MNNTNTAFQNSSGVNELQLKRIKFLHQFNIIEI